MTGRRAALRVAATASALLTLATACAQHRGERPPAEASRSEPALRASSRALAHALEDTLEGDFADPFVLRAAGTYYAFATGAGQRHVQLARSTDLVTWTELGDALPKLPGWAEDDAGLTWAPAVLARGDSFVLYYTVRDAASGFQCISVATAKTPAGPYVDATSAPLLCQVDVGDAHLCGSIDPSPFVDGDGSPYLLWKSDENSVACRGTPRIWSQRLTDDGLALAGDATVLLARTSEWEGDIIEAPTMTRYDGRYYLFYSANWYASSAYAIGYALCDGPAGPCEKKSVSEPLVGSAGAMLGPGGQEVFAGADGAPWLVFHAWNAPRTTYEAGGARSLRLARLEFTPEGLPRLSTVPEAPPRRAVPGAPARRTAENHPAGH